MRIIGGKFRGRLLNSPQDACTRPTSDRAREAIFNVLENGFHIKWSGLRVLDLYAGTGALGIEALSRGASFGLFIDNHIAALKTLEKNMSSFSNAISSLEDASHLKLNPYPPFDIIFVDPPYHQNLVSITLESLLKQNYLKKGSYIVIETSNKEEIDIQKPFQILNEKKYGKTKIIFSKSIP